MEQTVPLETATKHFAHAYQLGVAAGEYDYRQQVLELLKKHGQYEALLLIRRQSPQSK